MLKNKTRSGIAAAALAGATLFALPGSAQAAQTAPAAVEWGGVFPKGGHDFVVRSSTSTGASVITRVLGSDRRGVPCTKDRCVVQKGGSYKCWAGGPSGNEWFLVRVGKKTGYVARWCVEVGRWS